jgi:DNA-binding transcriptional LysR family regulator
MDAEALETFLTVYRLQSFSKAAQLMNRTQPAISRRVRLLEEELGVPLLERGAGEHVLSQAGRVLLPFAERALAALRDAEAAVRDLQDTNAGPVSVACVGTLAGHALATALKDFANAHPRVDIGLRTARSSEVSALVRRGEATIGIRYDRDASTDLELALLGVEALTVACGAEHRLAGRSIASLGTLATERWVAFPEIVGQREITTSHVLGLFRAKGLAEPEWTPVDSLTAQKRLVEAGLGLALMPRSSITEELATQTVRTIRVRDFHAGTEVFMITRKGGYLSAAARRLCEVLVRQYTLMLTSDESSNPGSAKRRIKRR